MDKDKRINSQKKKEYPKKNYNNKNHYKKNLYNTGRNESSNIKEWIKKSNISKLLEHAKKIIDNMKDENRLPSSSSIRRIYNPITKIQAQLDSDSQEWERELFLLAPRVTYLSAREFKLKFLKENIIVSLKAIEEVNDLKKKKESVKAFCYFMEAVVAYRKEKGN